MLEIITSSRFERDVKLAIKRHKDLGLLSNVILLLVHGDPLPTRVKDHALGGNWKHHRDLHIEPDWLLIYKLDGNDLYLVRTGSHADLF